VTTTYFSVSSMDSHEKNQLLLYFKGYTPAGQLRLENYDGAIMRRFIVNVYCKRRLKCLVKKL
jgi:hypothetical protein